MKTLKNLLFILCMSAAMTVQAQTQVIAHRGYWDCEGSAQNSITALRKAAGIQIYGSEFDVHLTADDKLVVNHDDAIQGYEIAETQYKTLKRLHLDNGERISTLKNYLKEGKKHPHLKLILEAKSLKSKEREDIMAKKIVSCVKKYNLEKQVEYISFSQNLCQQFKEMCPTSEIAYLNGDLSPKEVKDKGWTGIDYHFKVFKKHPEWIKEAHELGLKVNSWTVNSKEDMQELTKLKIDYLTTNNPPLAKKVVQQ